MIAARPAEHGLEPVHNRAGANMTGGVATALLEQPATAAAIGLFEVDEAWLRDVVADLSPHTVLLGNLFRDQLDRYGELEVLADDWSALVAARAGAHSFVLNADDPLVADLGRDRRRHRAERVTYFGLEDRSHALERIEHASDAKHCRRCGTRIYVLRCLPRPPRRLHVPELRQRAAAAAGVRRITWSCSAWRARAFTLALARGRGRVTLRLPGLYNVYNALGAAACACSWASSLEEVAARPGVLRRGVRAGGADRGRRAQARDPAGQEPRGCERGVPHAGGRRRRGPRRLDGPQRPHRRRARHLVDLGRGLRDARAARGPRGVLGHARRGAGPAAQVCGRRGGAAGSRPRARARL